MDSPYHLSSTVLKFGTNLSGVKDAARFYHDNAAKLAGQYESVSANEIHACWASFLPATRGLVLDVGAGTGRDAAWLASQGHEVVAVEPADQMRKDAVRRHPAAGIRWLDDALPDFKEVESLESKFDLILLSGVWMHIAPADRPRSFRKLANLLKPGGKLVFCLRDGLPGDRPAFETSGDELRALANKHLLELKLETTCPDACDRMDVKWTTLVFELRDDGTGALPLLRHIIINDAKSSTYKLALLRVLARIADGSPGLVLARNEEFVTLPFGLVALYWIRIFIPLVRDANFQQQAGSNAGLGFAKKAFRSLKCISATELRPGASFHGDEALRLTAAIRDARNTIKDMPAFHTTFPNSRAPVFPCETRRVRETSSISLDREFLGAMGTFKVPTPIWDALSQYACWIEPAIIGEWATLMRAYERKSKREKPLGEYIEALSWPELEKDTVEVRSIIEGLRSAGGHVYCVWSERRLTAKFQVDHAFPFARWPNNDLWNLLPVDPDENHRKGDKLVSAETLERSRPVILDWWETAYLKKPPARRFWLEAMASLPGTADFGRQPDSSGVFAGLQNQRVRLKVNQQIAEWNGPRPPRST